MHYSEWKRTAALLLVCIILIVFAAGLASADAEMRRVVVGADLTDVQIESVYQFFGFERGTVPELRLTNQEERSVLEGFVEPQVIGTRSMSCVYLELLPQGSGISISTDQISWCTSQMYQNALLTAGIRDARIAVAAPFAVSGTAGLAGIYKAYEDMTGQRLDEYVKDAGTQELTVTGALADEIGSADSETIVRELKQILGETANMSNDEVRAAIRSIADRHHVQLSENQVQQLLDLCRSLEKLNPDSLTRKVEDIQSTLEKVADAKDHVVGWMDRVKEAAASIRGFFDRLNGLFRKN